MEAKGKGKGQRRNSLGTDTVVGLDPTLSLYDVRSGPPLAASTGNTFVVG